MKRFQQNLIAKHKVKKLNCFVGTTYFDIGFTFCNKMILYKIKLSFFPKFCVFVNIMIKFQLNFPILLQNKKYNYFVDGNFFIWFIFIEHKPCWSRYVLIKSRSNLTKFKDPIVELVNKLFNWRNISYFILDFFV